MIGEAQRTRPGRKAEEARRTFSAAAGHDPSTRLALGLGLLSDDASTAMRRDLSRALIGPQLGLEIAEFTSS
jgi:hypothetical protein